MAKIGNFKMVSGELRGQIVTLALQAKSVRIVAEENLLRHTENQLLMRSKHLFNNMIPGL